MQVLEKDLDLSGNWEKKFLISQAYYTDADILAIKPLFRIISTLLAVCIGKLVWLKQIFL